MMPPYTPLSLTHNAGCSFEQLLAGVQAVLDVFIERGFAIRATVSNAVPDASGQGGTFRVRLEGPANLWGLQVGAGVEVG